MASPPYSHSPTALSPPYPAHSQLPAMNTMTNKKRASEGGAAPALKRRKASTMSVTSFTSAAHPLRQTSFPPDEIDAAYSDARSPSVDVDAMSLVSGSQVSAAAPPKKKRGRKSKAEKAREQTPSVAGGRATSTVNGAGEGGRGTKSQAGGGGGADDEGDEGDGPTEVAATADTRTKEQKEEEHRARNMLIGAFTPLQFDRFENWRAGNLSKASVRRLVNATISQSVTENVVISVRAMAKLFVGDIVESARRVQDEWVEKTNEKQTDLPTPPASVNASPDRMGFDEPDQHDSHKKDNRRGPLRPEHLREAFRRYKASLEGGGVGMHTLWHQQQQNGVDRYPTRTGGRRIFR
ncbi:transcription initiation factor TFIID-like protein [Diplogelasinospora grovesii]|uniref:Transcription initiation factor TFIID-like protein n=1 Tax=Diplogelasinospora grovesii TaxID=303347 RepID=A0AAN6S2I6_9PEZI|nr:transcription initiation factor TFIID-like protein [Diplogelasinospora grovesii]